MLTNLNIAVLGFIGAIKNVSKEKKDLPEVIGQELIKGERRLRSTCVRGFWQMAKMITIFSYL